MKSTITFLFLSIVGVSYGQQQQEEPKYDVGEHFMSSLGAFYAQPINITKENNYAGLSFSPQLNLLHGYYDFNIAIGSQIDAGYRVSNDTGKKFMYSIPAVITFNYGHMASKDFYSRFGVFGGGGFAFGAINGKAQQGVMLTAGLRTWFLKQSLTIRYSRLIYDEFSRMHIIALQVNLGSYLKQVYKNNQISRFTNSRPNKK